MSKKADVKQLASALQCSFRQAREFGHQVNRCLAEMGCGHVSYRQIGHDLRFVGGRNCSPEAVARRLASLHHGSRISQPSNCSSVPSPRATLPTPFRPETPDVLPSTSPSQAYQPFPVEADIGGEEPKQEDVLVALLSTRPDQVTYGQIEEALRQAGFDPYQAEDVYAWAIDQLENQGILVVDSTVADQIGPDQGITTESDVREIQALLNGIYGSLAEDGRELLTNEEQRRLIEIYREGQRAQRLLRDDISDFQTDILAQIVVAGNDALCELLQRNRRLVASVALKYGRHARHLTIEDLIQEGMMGLHRAIERFDLDSGTHLSTYATFWIRQSVTRCIADCDRAIRLPVHRVDSLNQCRRVKHELQDRLGRPPTDQELALHVNRISPRAVEAIQQAWAERTELAFDLEVQLTDAVAYVQMLQRLEEMQTISLDQPVKEDGDTTLGELIPDPRENSTEDTVFRHALAWQLQEVFDCLTGRERRVLVQRFDLDGDGSRTLEEIGLAEGVTRERVRQIEAKALHKLRQPYRCWKLADFIDF